MHGRNLCILCGHQGRRKVPVIAFCLILLWTTAYSSIAFAEHHQHSGSLIQVRSPRPDIRPDTITAASFSSSLRFLAIGSACGEVRLWDIQSGKELHSFWPCDRARFQVGRPSPQALTSLQFSPDEQVLYARSHTALGAWKTQTGEALFRHDVRFSWTTSIRLAESGKYLVTIANHSPPFPGESETVLSYYDAVNGHIERELHLPTGKDKAIMGLELSPANGPLGAGNYGAIRFWNSVTGDELVSIPASDFVVKVAYSQDGRLLASMTSIGEYDLWEVATGRKVRHLGKFGAGGKHMAFLDATKLLVGSSGRWKLLDIRTGEEREGHGSPIANPGGNHVLFVANRTLELWDFGSGERRKLPEDSELAVNWVNWFSAMSGDGKWLWRIRTDRSSWILPVELLSTDTGERIRRVLIPGWCELHAEPQEVTDSCGSRREDLYRFFPEQSWY